MDVDADPLILLNLTEHRTGQALPPLILADGILDVLTSEVPDSARVMNMVGAYISPGFVDTHAHIYQHVTGIFGLAPDEVGIGKGVTTLVDQGGPSCLTIDGFRNFIVNSAKTRVVCFISSYLAGGLMGHLHIDLFGPTCMNVRDSVAAIEKNRDIVFGIKIHTEPAGYARWGVEPLRLAREIADLAQLPLYVHLGTLWPKEQSTGDLEAMAKDYAALLRPGDILAHPFTRFPSGFTMANGNVNPVITAALDKGVELDVGRGSHMSYETAQLVLAQGIRPRTLGADMHGFNTNADTPHQKRFDLFSVMSELVALGVSERNVVEMVTSNTADFVPAGIARDSLDFGEAEDFTIFSIERGPHTFFDSLGIPIVGEMRFAPAASIRNGFFFEAP